MIHASLLSAVLLLPLAPPQQPRAADPTRVLALDAVRLESFIPQHVAAGDLFQVAHQTLGRDVWIAERGGTNGRPASNLALMADRILVYDDPTYVELILDSLRKLDQQDPAMPARRELIAREYAPRYITLDSAYAALASYDNRGSGVVQMGGGPRIVSAIAERNVLVLRDTEARVAEMSKLLSSLDRPEPQAILKCYIVRGAAEGDPKGLPSDLVKNLGALVPELRFTSVGFGLLRTSVASGRDVALRLEALPGYGAFELSMLPVAYDPATASLTVQRCRLDRNGPAAFAGATGAGAGREQIFSTNAVLRGGEYTVLGASGSEPLFLVLHLTPVQ
jgi:hypothetical protein